MTELHAIGPVTTAFGKTKKLLLEPFDVGLWIKLVIITFFVGSGSGAYNPGSNFRYALDRGDMQGLPLDNYLDMLSDPVLITAIVLLVLAVVAVALLMSYLRGVFSFVLLNALSTGTVRIIQPFKENMGRGFKAFLFNIAAGIISLAFILGIIAVVVLVLLLAIGRGDPSSMSPAAILLLIFVVVIGIMLAVAFSLLMSLVIGFFYDFGVPLIYFKGMGLRQAISAVIGMVRKDPLEFLVYVIVRWVLELAVSLVLGIVLLFFFAIFIGVGVLLVVAMIEAAEINLLLAAFFGLTLVAGLLLITLIGAVLSLPVNVYFRYYSLDFLKSMDPAAVAYSGRFA